MQIMLYHQVHPARAGFELTTLMLIQLPHDHGHFLSFTDMPWHRRSKNTPLRIKTLVLLLYISVTASTMKITHTLKGE